MGVVFRDSVKLRSQGGEVLRVSRSTGKRGQGVDVLTPRFCGSGERAAQFVKTSQVDVLRMEKKNRAPRCRAGLLCGGLMVCLLNVHVWGGLI